MSITVPSSPIQRRDANLLRTALRIDALATGAMALGLLIGAAPLSDLLNLPTLLLRGSGAVLVAFVVLLAWLQRGDRIPRGATWAVVAINVLWVVGSIGLLFSGWVNPTALGVAFVVVQALAVLVFAEMQYFGLKRSR